MATYYQHKEDDELVVEIMKDRGSSVLVQVVGSKTCAASFYLTKAELEYNFRPAEDGNEYSTSEEKQTV